MEPKEHMGVLFESIAYNDTKDLENLIDNLSFSQSYYILTSAIEYSFRSGIYSLPESEILSKALRLLNKEFTKTPESEEQ